MPRRNTDVRGPLPIVPRTLTVAETNKVIRRIKTETVVEDRGYKTACLIWTRYKDRYGYARVWKSGTSGRRQPLKVTRIILVIQGRLAGLDDPLWALHRCHQRDCVRPSHLYPGTPSQNTQDAVKAGRLRDNRGELHGAARLTDEKVRAIRAASGTMKDIATRFGTHAGTVCNIKQRKAWKHVV